MTAHMGSHARDGIRLKGADMINFLTSELFGKFLGGFVLGTVLVFTFSGDDEPVALDGSPAAVAALES